MTDPPTEAVAVLVDAPLARPGERPTANPAQLYVASLNTRQSRKTAIESMGRLLKGFGHPGAEWWSFPWWKVTAQETTIVRRGLVDAYAPSTAKLTLCVLRGILRQCYRLELMTADTYQRAILLDPITVESVPTGRMLKPEEIRTLVGYIDGMGGGDYAAMVGAIFAAALGGGLRREELASLRVDALADDNSTLRLIGKGRKERVQPLPAWAGARVRRWLDVRGERCSQTLFLRTQGFKLKDREPSVWSIWSLIVETGKAAEVASFAPHDLRRTFASRMLDKGDLSIAQKAMAHKSPTTTVRYDRREEGRLAASVAELEGYGFEK